MSCYVREMTADDLKVVTEIDREAFPTQWPPPNYGNEFRNRSAHFIVACDEGRTIDRSSADAAPPQEPGGLAGWFRRLLKRTPAVPQARSSPDHYIVGFVCFWVLADEAHITSIAVREKYRRQGIGELLLMSAVDKACHLKADILTLEVRVSNTSAQGLYAKYGFVQVGRRRAYYTDNREDAFIMSTDKIASALFQSRFQQLKQDYSARSQRSEVKGQN